MSGKKKWGFGLIEVMLGLLVAALIATPLTRLVMSVIQGVAFSGERLLDQDLMKRFLYESRFFAGAEETFSREEIVDGKKTILFHRVPVSEKSVFSKPLLCKEEVIIKDKTAPKEITSFFATFYAVIPESKKAESEKKEEKETKKLEGAP